MGSRNRRPLLLHSCGVSLFSMAHKIYSRAEESDNAVGSVARTLAHVAGPILYPVQLQWLSVLSFIDNQILAAEDIAMTIFPPSAFVFSKIDELAFFAESVPKKFDNVVDYLLSLIEQLPLLDWASKNANTMLRHFLGNSENEKDVMVDVQCYEQPKVTTTDDYKGGESNNEMKSERTEQSGKFLHDKVVKARHDEDIKEVEEACNEIIEALEEMGIVEGKKVNEDKEKQERRDARGLDHQSVSSKDPIIELFDQGWQLKPIRRKKDK